MKYALGVYETLYDIEHVVCRMHRALYAIGEVAEALTIIPGFSKR